MNGGRGERYVGVGSLHSVRGVGVVLLSLLMVVRGSTELPNQFPVWSQVLSVPARVVWVEHQVGPGLVVVGVRHSPWGWFRLAVLTLSLDYHRHICSWDRSLGYV